MNTKLITFEMYVRSFAAFRTSVSGDVKIYECLFFLLLLSSSF
jgi:hypothetical protein